MKRNPLYEQFERDLEERKAMDRVWVQFLDVLTGQAPADDIAGLFEISENELEAEEERDGTLRDGMRRFTGSKP